MNYKSYLDKHPIFNIVSDSAEKLGVEVYVIGGYVRAAGGGRSGPFGTSPRWPGPSSFLGSWPSFITFSGFETPRLEIEAAPDVICFVKSSC